MVIPSATYRIQFNSQFTFKQLLPIIPYLAQLGISTIYASPILTAIKDSSHGYDVCNYEEISSSIGTLETLKELHKKLKQHGITWVQDIVPNHMAFVTSNMLVWDLLQRGTTSPYANFFDINWQHPRFANKLMVAVLEAPLKTCLNNKKLSLAFSDKGVVVKYYSNEYPVPAATYATIFNQYTPGKKIQAAFDQVQEAAASSYKKWNKAQEALLGKLKKPNAAKQLVEVLEKINADDALLKQIIDAQNYILTQWDATNTSINYRRFFNINTLIGVRMEDETVFEDYHHFIHRLYKHGIISGLRIDHIDGLKDPVDYFKKMRQLFGSKCYIVAEKILAYKEVLPPELDIQGTTGYDFLALLNRLFTNEKGAQQLTSWYHKLMPQSHDFAQLVFNNKWNYLNKFLAGEWENLFQLLCETSGRDKDNNPKALKKALGVFMASFSVYRIYTVSLPLDETSDKIVANAFAEALKRYPALKKELKEMETIFTAGETELEKVHFIQKMMQIVSPLTAKGVEDTTFYQYNALISHNEVGDDPETLSSSVEDFHEAMQQRQLLMPLTQNATSTHDTKRGEDARLRIHILAELAEEWLALTTALNKATQPARAQKAPSDNELYMLYQSIVGSFPELLKITSEYIERTQAFFNKAIREGGVNSSHYNPDTAYEKSCNDFIYRLLSEDNDFLRLLVPFIKKIILQAGKYSVAQLVIKAAAPGIPDFYQGTELYNTSYVDPDNRRQVNYKKPIALMNKIESFGINERGRLLKWMHRQQLSGAQKLFVTRQMLLLRKKLAHLFTKGEYIPLTVIQEEKNIIAFCREYKDKWVIVIAQLNTIKISEEDYSRILIELPKVAPGHWQNIFTLDIVHLKKSITAKEVFKKFPVAVFESID